MPIDFPILDPSSTRLRADPGTERPDHFVEFYDDDRSLTSSVTRFLSIGIAHGEAAIVIAGDSHRKAIEAELGRIIDLSSVGQRGLYRSLDAEEMLARFMHRGLPEAGRFDRVIGDIVRQASNGGRRLRAFGEMVDILWQQGNVTGALALEDLWNELALAHPFKLFCAYRTDAFDTEGKLELAAICDRHSHVLLPRSL